MRNARFAIPSLETPASPTTPDREFPAGTLLYLVLVGLVAVATIGVFFGTGFSLLGPPRG